METLYRTGLSNAVSATALALAVACLGRVFTRRPAVLHTLWVLVLVKLVAPPMFEVPVPWPAAMSAADEPARAPAAVVLKREPAVVRATDAADLPTEVSSGSPDAFDEGPDEQATERVVAARSIDWTRIACLVWMTGTVVTLITSLGRIRRFQILLSGAELADDRTQTQVAELAARLGLHRSPSVWWFDGRLSPMIWPVGWRPRLILPRALWKGLDDRQRAGLIIHELAHLRRGDHHLRIFELTVTALYWWHPVLWWARRALRGVEEQCCDAWVVWALPGAAKSYADTLLETLEFLSYSDRPEPLLASGFGQVRHLRKRLTMIMNASTPRTLGTWGTLGTLGLAILLLPVNATWAQKAEQKKEVRIIVKNDGNATATATATTGTAAGGANPKAKAAVKTGAQRSLFIKADTIINADGSKTTVVTDSTDEAVKQLKEKIKEIAKKSPQSEKDKAHQKALELALEELESAVAKVGSGYLSAKALAKVGNEREILVQKVRELQGFQSLEQEPLSTGKKAEIEKARAKVEELTNDLQSKQRELHEARRKLTALMAGKMGLPTLHVRVFDPEMKVDIAKPRYEVSRPVDPHVASRPVDPSQKRIDELEKKLEKVLEEVAKLKKDRSK